MEEKLREIVEDSNKKLQKTLQDAQCKVLKEALSTWNQEIQSGIKCLGLIIQHDVKEDNKKKREREEEDDDDSSSSSSSSSSSEKEKKKKITPVKPVADPGFKCPGRVWEKPVIPCGNGPQSQLKAGTQIIDEKGKHKNISICKDCKKIRDAQKRAAAAEKKKAAAAAAAEKK